MLHQHKSYAKCMLFGAHAILRGASALACPLQQYHCEIQWRPNPQQTGISLPTIKDSKLTAQLQAFLQHALQKANIAASNFTGELHIKNTIPIASNLGSSAALCLNISRLFCELGFIQASQQHAFATHCEHFFHGTSSGFDIKALSCPSKHILLYHQHRYDIVQPLWHPPLYLLASTKKASTQTAIATVAQWQQQQWDRGKSIDKKMHEASLLAFRAMTQPTATSTLRYKWFKKAMQDAYQCYQHWGLAPAHTHKIIHNNRDTFSCITPIGAGGGGHLLALAHPNEPHTTHTSEQLQQLFI